MAQVDPPETPAGAVLRAWLGAINSGDEAALRVFQRDFAPDRTDLVERALSMYRRSGGFELIAIEGNEPERVRARLRERGGGGIAGLTLTTVGDPPRLAGIMLGPAATPLPQLSATLDPLAALDEAAERSEFSGALLVARDGAVLFEEAYGSADRTNGTPNTVGTRFNIGSMNKMFTAVAILQLVGRGAVRLDAPLREYLPDYPNEELASKVTIRHLLTHTGGTGDIFTPAYASARAATREPADVVALFGARGVAFEPGTRSAYSNYGYVLLGRVVEAVSGVSYFDYVRENVFEPAGMVDTVSPPEAEPVPSRAIGYTRQSGSLQPNTEQLPWRGTPAGGGYSTVHDLLRFAQALESGKLLPPALLEEATRSQGTGGPGYGFGFGVRGSGARAHFGHNGGAPGVNGELRIYPVSGYVVIALANLDPPAASQLVELFEERLADGGG
jgi:CubicO group peptidase (beta-lactamase class C family)